MATSKTLAPTNVTISIPAMTDAPDASVFSNCVDKEADAINALNSQLTYEYEIPTGYDNTIISAIAATRRGGVVQVNVTFKSGLAAEWHNGITTGLSARFRPATATYGAHRVNSSADITKNIIAFINTDGTMQMLNDSVFNADVPFSFTFVVAS